MPDPDSLARSLRVVAITDSKLADPRPIEDVVRAALEGGCRCIQLREKGSSAREMLARAQTLRSLTRDYDALLIVNDRFDVALAAEADGVHLGPDDPPLSVVRAATPEWFVIGASCDDVATARRFAAAGASYLGCGAVFATRTKADAGPPIGVERVRELARAVRIPIVAIGGIDAAGASALSSSGARGIAVVSAIMGAPDPEAATRELLTAFAPAPI